jgi:hypothetical protein
MVTDADEDTWAEGEDYIIAPLANLPTRSPVRARKINLSALYEIVTVVGARGFAATTDPRTGEMGLVEKSLKLARQFDVHFATVTWSIDGAAATPVRLSDSPEDAELRYAWSEVASALCDDLTR